MLWRHLFLIIFVSLLGLGLGSWGAWYSLNHYKAEAILLFQDDLPKTLPGGLPLNNLSAPTALDLITLPANLQTVQSLLGLDISDKELEQMVTVPQPRNLSHLIHVICRTDHPNLSIEIANALAKTAVKSSRQMQQRQLETVLRTYTKQFDEANLQLARELSEIESFKKTHRYFEMAEDFSALNGRIAEARTKLQNAILQSNNLAIEFQNLKREADQMPMEILAEGAPKVDPWQGQIVALQGNLAEAKARYTPENPKIKILQQQLDDLFSKQKQFENEAAQPRYVPNESRAKLQLELVRLEAQIRAGLRNKQEAADFLSGLENLRETLPSDQITLSGLLKAKQNTEERVGFLSKAIATIQLMQNIPKGGLEVYQLADKARTLYDTRWASLFPIFGLFSGLFLGTGLVLAKRKK